MKGLEWGFEAKMSQKKAPVDGYEMVLAFDGKQVGNGGRIIRSRALCTYSLGSD